MRVLTKSDYAKELGIAPSTLSSWIARGHLTAPALLPDGRVDADAADLQLGERLDQSRSIGKLFARSGEPATAASELATRTGHREFAQGIVAASERLGGEMAAIKLEQAQRGLRRDREGDLERRGIYVRAADIRREHARELAAFIGTVEQRLPELVQLLGGGKAETVTARRWWRSLRQAEADAAQVRADAEPEFTEERELVDAA